MIVGIDEVGRGPWAGPLVMGAVVLGCEINGLTDSKKLTKKRREELDIEIRKNAAGVGLGWVTAEEIDTLGLASALQLACRRALEEIDTLGVAYHEIIIDGTINFLKDTGRGKFVTTLKKADLLIPSVSAASIVAKVARDNYMIEQDDVYPGYKFGSHVGYGTAAHQAAIELLGVTPLHRLSFAPLQKYRSDTSLIVSQEPQKKPFDTQSITSTRSVGDVSETVAANELVRQGHKIVARNWRTKYCEIDIVSRKDDIVYFTEVKHRHNDKGGDGLAAITPKKLNQMKFAAKLYAHTNHLDDADLRLIAIATTGSEPVVTDIIEIE